MKQGVVTKRKRKRDPYICEIFQYFSSESSKDQQFSSNNDDKEVGYLSLPSENEMHGKIRELHGSVQDSSDDEPPFNCYTKVLKDTSKTSGTIKNLSEPLTCFSSKKIL